MFKDKYTLTTDGERLLTNNEFYLKQPPKYRDYTEKIFRTLFNSGHKTIAEIVQTTGIGKCAVKGVITYNLMAGFIRKADT